ncbi:MAG TPA: propionate--CoA ligase [Ideonella sp.]|nr:propionate--CoA ligase [Ideonella sp.]HSI50468.1 propionate--CoA ligase [Ideonella sp.]
MPGAVKSQSQQETKQMPSYTDFYRRSLDERDGFWAEQAALIDWQRPFDQVCDAADPRFPKWFAGGLTNLCHNAVDRHLRERADQAALIFVSSETGVEKTYSFRELHAEVQRFAAILKAQGVGRGDRVLVYMPMVAEAAFAMLACVRVGAIHSVVFGGFASHALASRIDDAQPVLVVSADAGMRGGKVVAYKPLLDEAIELAAHKPAKVLMVDRGLVDFARVAGRDLDFATERAAQMDAVVPCEWVDSAHPSYILYTSGTTGRPKGVQRDTGGHAVALAASMRHIYMAQPGETFFSTSDIGWVVGHSYIVYGPLLNGMATVMYEGLPTRPDAAVWWRIVEQYKVNVMFSAPTAARVLKKQDPACLTRHDLSSLKALFLAGEPLDEPTATWMSGAIGKPVIDNYWQTETGWPILAICNGVELAPTRYGSPGRAVYGFDVRLVDENSGEEITEPNRKGVIAVQGPLPPGCLQTVWGDDERYVKTYWSSVPGRALYSSFDWGLRDADGYYFILGRTDDVINVAGHRLGTREIEESISSHAAVSEVAVVGVADALKGQVAMAFVVLKDAALAAEPADALKLEGAITKQVEEQLGAVARPARVRFVSLLPKTRSGKLLRRAMQAVCEGRDPGDLTTMDDPGALQQIRDLLGAPDSRPT